MFQFKVTYFLFPMYRSDISLLYNDHAVQENHHVSAVYRLLQNNDETNILSNLSKDDWRWEEKVISFSLSALTEEPVEKLWCCDG